MKTFSEKPESPEVMVGARSILGRPEEGTADERKLWPGERGALTGNSLVKRDEQNALVEAINQAFEEAPPTAEEKELLQGIRAIQRRRLEAEG